MIVTVLGSCANQTVDREGVALLVEDDDGQNQLLVDTGPGIVAALGRAHRLAAEINVVVLTHCHGDHLAGFPYFVWQRHYERLGQDQPAKDLLVLGLPHVLRTAEAMLDGCYADTHFPFHVHYTHISPSTTLEQENFQITVVGVTHATATIGLVIDRNGKRVAISSDTLPNIDFIKHSSGADLLLHEGMWTEKFRDLADRTRHSTASDAAQVALKSNSSQLVMLHIFPPLLGRERELLIEASATFHGPISIPHDGSVYRV